MTISEMMNFYHCTEEELYKKIYTKLYEKIKMETGKKCVAMKLHPGESDVLSSKIGGLPFIPEDGAYPVNSKSGKKLYLLIQLNFSEMPKLENFPQKGILQIFIDGEECYGINWDDPQCQDSYRVLYYDDISNPMPIESVQGLMPEISEETDLPFENMGDVFTIGFEKGEMAITIEDFRFDSMTREIFDSILPEELQGKDIYDMPVILRDELYELFSGSHSRIGGYPGFTQDDPREDRGLEDYELLLQIDSESNGKESYLMWGDCGIANFFIRPDDLKKKDFSKVYYNWDCC